MKHLPADITVTAHDINAAFEGTSVHSSSGEPYFWSHAYNVIPVDYTIPIDEMGRAHVFKPVIARRPTVEPTTSHSDDVKFWKCNARLCNIAQDSIDGTVRLLRGIVQTRLAKVVAFYLHIDDCTNREYCNKLGHFADCNKIGCCDSLLRPARILSCHFTRLRSLVRRLYEIRLVCICTDEVMKAV